MAKLFTAGTIPRQGVPMRSLVVGGGGREHCIVRALERSGAEIYAVSGNRNPGIMRSAKEFHLLDPMDIDHVVSWAASRKVDLAVIGPEAPLGAGLSDALISKGIATFGPTKAAARIETSKEYARNLMRKHNVQGLIDYWAFDDLASFQNWVKDCDFEFVIKPVGLTGGKGVKVWGDHFNSKPEAAKYAEEIVKDKIGGSTKFLVEEKAVGEEFSLQVFTDGKKVVPMPLAQDHKRAYEGDKGPNTGGMGSYSDADHLLPFVTKSEQEGALDIMNKTVDAMAAEGTPFRGCLYGGFINTAQGPKVIEFNCRFADPECMNVLPIMLTDFAETCAAAAGGSLRASAQFEPKATVCKYVVPQGYGTKSIAGQPIEVDEKAISDSGAQLFWASVDEKDGKIVTATSRSLAVVGIEDTLAAAEEVAEQALTHVKGQLYVRHDIGKKDVVMKRVLHMKSLRKGRD